ncbi:hypothetical protein B566_EDAN008332 [Ephemera danica]|nr:hypothetical protein B566_EDAN008332 [Ephemera danica]
MHAGGPWLLEASRASPAAHRQRVALRARIGSWRCWCWPPHALLGGVCRGRLCALSLILGAYLAGVLLLSSISLDVDPRRYHFYKAAAEVGTGGLPRGGQAGGRAELAASLRSAAAAAASTSRRSRLHWCRPLRFVEPPGAVVALVSFPGSGNTWVRYLIQQATGVYTGSVYKDYGLLKNGFPAESVVNGSVVVVKTHESGAAARAPFQRAVLLKLATWTNTYMDWLRNFPGPKHILLYERLVANVEPELRSLLTFLNVTLPEPSLLCALSRREGIYRRRRRLLPFDPFTPAMKEALRREQDALYSALTANVSTVVSTT